MHLLGKLCPRFIAAVSMLGFALALTSCSGGKTVLNPVRGKVLFKDAPAAGVLVTLHQAGGTEMTTQASTGYTEEDGSFDITTGQDEGAPAGEYIVTMVWMQDTSGAKKKPGVIQMNADTAVADKLKGRYGDRKRPSFPNITIKKGVNQLEPFRLQ
jgi:hypothetical protein